MIDQTVIDIINRLDIVSVIQGEGVALKEKRGSYEGCCPFHSEKTPSFKVNPSKGFYKCFGCGEGGGVITFVMKLHTKTFPEAIEYLAKKYNIEYEARELTPEENEARFKRETLYIVNKYALDYFLAAYKESADAQKYATGRWSPETIEDQQIGYAPASWDGLIKYAKGLDYTTEVLIEAGLARQGEKGPYDFFRNRIMFPVRNQTGHIVGFSGRDITKKTDKKIPKYLNTPETLIFKKGELLFGMFEGRREARKTGRWNLVEGGPDVIRMIERKVPNTVAPLGTALTDYQIKLLKADAKTVIIIGDTDDAGRKAVLKNGEALFRAGLNVSVMLVPVGKDPDEYFSDLQNHYDDALAECTTDFIHYYAQTKLYGQTSTADIVDRIKEVCELLYHCPEESTIDLYLDNLGKEYKPKSTWTKEFGKIKNRKQMEARTMDSEAENEMWRKYGFIEEKHCYYGQGRNGNVRWSNFVMKPLAHVRSMMNSKRLYIITNEFRHEQTVELKADELVSLSKFRIRVESLGNYLWEAGEPELFKLKNYIFHNTETCDEITQLGWQKRWGFYAWGNGGFADGKYHKADEIGILRIGDRSFYLPAFSRIFENETQLFQFERKFVFAQSNGITLHDYVEKLIEVFGDNGKVAFCFLVATLFKDIVTSYTKSFPILNLFGPKGSGKTELGQSLTSFFITKNIAPNINNTTIPALAEAVAQVSNAIVHLDEYKNSIDMERREFLKGLWDGAGRTRMNMDRDKKREMTTVDSGVVLSGQEMPTADIALFSRLIFLTFHVTEYSDDGKRRFKELKQIEGRGLTHLTNEILSHRGRMEGDFNHFRNQVASDLQGLTKEFSIEDRTLYNWTTPLAAFRCLESALNVPITYQELLTIARNGIVDQQQKTRQNGELAGFWESVENLVRSSKLWIGVDYHIKYLPREIRVHQSTSTITLDPKRRYLQISFNRIAQLYAVDGKATGEKRIPKDSLKYYLEHSPEFKGTMKAVRFRSVETPTGLLVAAPADALSSRLEGKTVVTTAMVFDYEAIQENYDIDINIQTTPIDDEPEETDEPEKPF